MLLTTDLKAAFLEVGRAVRRPEALALRWRDRATAPQDAPVVSVFTALLVTAVLGLTAYGLTMGLHAGSEAMLLAALKAPTAAGSAWAIALPSLYILNSTAGSRLDASTTALAALATCSFGALAMLASVPVNWFFTLALPYPWARWAVSFLVFSGVGVCMTDVFARVMRALEPERARTVPFLWLALMGALGGELMILLNLFDF